ncbi:2OG-Fe(II) oxygenase [Pendulispora albinea]|uniref:2OG-Fe(II) oxygenase n=1 Tax=Pendulispora albinea TaxID=2741071 RepID=A0ABZ2M451_9BACT
MEHPDFIEVYENALDLVTCTNIIRQFQTSERVQRGRTGGGVDLELKDSWDMSISNAPEWSSTTVMLNQIALRCLRLYLRKFAHAIVAPLHFKTPNPATGALQLVRAEELATTDESFLTTLAVKAFRPGDINLQKYESDVGGYPYWHCELYPKRDDHGETLHRVLLWTLYLNDSFTEGETEFLYQSRKIRPKAGSLLIAPTAFTHTHRGNRPKGGDKYIATSWILFRRAEQLYEAQPASAR